MSKTHASLRSVSISPCVLLISLFSYSQDNFRVKGKVTGQTGKPLELVTLSAKGRSIATAKAEGSFGLNVLSENSTLIFTSLGYGEQEWAPERKNQLNNKDATNLQPYHKLRPIPVQQFELTTINGQPMTTVEKAAYQDSGY